MDIEKVIDGLVSEKLMGMHPTTRPTAKKATPSKVKASGAITQDELDAMYRTATDNGEAEDLMQGMEDFEKAVTARTSQWEGVSADWKDTEGLVDSFKEALGKLGIQVFENPQTAGSDMMGYILVKQ